MRCRTTILTACAAGVFALVTSTLTGTSAAAPNSQDARPSWCMSGASVPVDVLAAQPGTHCDSDVRVVVAGAPVGLPQRGESLTVDVLTVTGDRHVTLARGEDGVLSVLPEVPISRSARPAASAACTSNAFKLYGFHWAGGYRWSYNPKSAPSAVSAVTVAALKTATTNIVNGRNDCGLSSRPATSQSYQGVTTRTPSCSVHDRFNVTGWSTFADPNLLALTCTLSRISTREAVESDALIDIQERWTVSSAGCSKSWDLQGVMTHERGHTYGLDHTTASSALTMYPIIRACDFSRRTLGKGDLSGLMKIYGAR